MGILLNTSNPMMIIMYTLIVAGLIFIARKTECVWFAVFIIVASIGFLIYHSVVLDMLSSSANELISQTYHCIAVDLILLLLGFISYLWVDELEAKHRDKKSIDNSLDWFWSKII